MTVSDLLCECKYEQGTNHNLWFRRGFSVHLVPLTQTEGLRLLKLNYDDIIAEKVRNKSTEKNSGIQLVFEASETDRQCHQNTF